MTVLEQAAGLKDYIVGLRRHFHENPELSSKEDATIARIGEELAATGIPYVVVENGGIVATLKGDKPGRSILLRADVDALPVQESPDNKLAGGRTCVSKNGGVMHACGHDGHTAMLLGAAKILASRKTEIAGTVYFVFERGEEGTGNYVQLLKYLGANGIAPDGCYGTHLYADLESGKLGIIDGGVMAGVVGFNVTIEGRGGHGSRPDQSLSPVDCFAAIYQALEGLRLKSVNPFEALTYSVGLLRAGEVSNVIPQTLTFGGTARFFSAEKAGAVFVEEFRHIVDNICAAYHCTPTYNALSRPSSGVINDHECALFAQKELADALGPHVVCSPEPWMASESFSAYLRLYPGVFALLGINNPEKGTGAPHHSVAFDIDEDVLPTGAAAASAYALAFLDHGPDTGDRKYPGTFDQMVAGENFAGPKV